jgi:hypothetical protein
MGSSRGITIEREVLLFEIERRCPLADCNQRVFIGLTKEEASGYNGFACPFCESWNPDELKRTDIPDWWEEIQSNQQPAH